ncbi:MAG: hypothetical protein BRD48_02390, partial [Bacteroidetes bacterium QS_9_68_14]
EAVQITTEGGFVAQEGPRGKHLYYTKRNAPGLWKRSREGGEEEHLASEITPQDGAAWAVRGDHLYHVQRSGTTPVLVRRPLADGTATVVASLDRAARDASVALSPDARWVFYAREDRRESDLMFVESF